MSRGCWWCRCCCCCCRCRWCYCCCCCCCYCHASASCCLKKNLNTPRPSEHPPVFVFSFFFFHLTYSRWTSHYHPACGHKGSSHLSPVHALQFFYRDASSALLQLVNQWLNFTYSRSHAFRHERKNTNPTLVRIELTTSVLADVQLTYSGGKNVKTFRWDQ